MDSVVGLLPQQWMTLLKDNHFNIEKARGLTRAAMISALTVRNRLFLSREKKLYPGSTTAGTNKYQPLFIIGHWRSGTTFLHNLLSQDEQFTFPRTFQVNNPHTFIHIGQKYKVLLHEKEAWKRAMDNVRSSLISPAEDEFALAALTLHSPVVGWLFPKRQIHYDRYTTFESCDQRLVDNWKKSYISFFQKLSFLRPGKIILSKSPLNTARLQLLAESFPNARFIFLHRNPFKVFSSTIRLYETAIARSSLQEADYDVSSRILERYSLLHSAYLKQRSHIPEEKLLEISFDELEKTPVETVEKIYNFHGIKGFPEFKPELNRYISGLTHKKNKYPELKPEIVDKIQRLWEPYLQEWNYKL